MIYEFAKKLVWQQWYNGDLTTEERDEDLREMERAQTMELPTIPTNDYDSLLYIESWKGN